MRTQHYRVASLFCFLALSCVHLSWPALSTAEEGTKKTDAEIKHPTQQATLVVSLLDEDHKPIVGARILAYGCRCEEEPGTGWGWPTHNMGEPESVLTDQVGKASVNYPVKFGADPDWMTTSEISMMVTHPEFIAAELNVDPRNQRTQASMRHGCKLTFSGVNASGASVEFGIVIAGPGRSAEWLTDETDAKYSGSIPDGTWQTMLVSPGENGLHLFSGVLPIRLRNQQNVSLRNLSLSLGRSLSGRLSDNVPRPVSGGKVIAHCMPKPAGESWGDEDPSVTWETFTSVEPDGTFEFPSLPRSGLVQLIVFCDGFLGENGKSPEQMHSHHGTFVDFDQHRDGEVLVMKMEPTGTAWIKVVQPDGTPLVGATVGSNPNHTLYLGGSTILGSMWDSIDGIRHQLDPSSPTPDYDLNGSRFRATTDEKGIATVRGLPVGSTQSVYAWHEAFVIPSIQGGHNRSRELTIDDTNPKELTIAMVALETALTTKKAAENLGALQKAAEALGDFLKK